MLQIQILKNKGMGKYIGTAMRMNTALCCSTFATCEQALLTFGSFKISVIFLGGI